MEVDHCEAARLHARVFEAPRTDVAVCVFSVSSSRTPATYQVYALEVAAVPKKTTNTQPDSWNKVCVLAGAERCCCFAVFKGQKIQKAPNPSTMKHRAVQILKKVRCWKRCLGGGVCAREKRR